MPNTTLSLHSHTVYSQRDSICQVDAIVGKVAKAGCTHYAVTDHGTVQGWLAVRDACKKAKVIPMYGCELYVNDFIQVFHAIRQAKEAAPKKEQSMAVLKGIKELVAPLMTSRQFVYFMGNLKNAQDAGETAKQLLTRLGYGYEHLVAVAVNAQGRENLIRLHNLGWMEGHYAKPQVTTEQCLAHADGIIWTTACMGGPIAKRMRWDPTGDDAKAYLKRWEARKANFFLEVQPLDLLHQRRNNAALIKLSQETGFPLILSQDNHHVDEGDWLSHRALMLAQNDEPIEKLEDIYLVGGKQMALSDLKRHLGCETTWQAQEKIEQDKLELIQPAGHHYGDVRLHWRTNDDIRRECEKNNPELMPVLDQCFAVTDRLCSEIKDIPWPTKHRLTHYDNAREQVLRVCVQRMEQIGLVPKTMDDAIAVDEHGNHIVDKRDTYVQWLQKEDKVISACGFWDYIWTLYRVTKAAQDEGIPIGYARGSGGGCLVMYLLGIIRVDPIEYGLFFERFLNPARLGLDPKTLQKVKDMASCPDVDLDFSSIHRQRVIAITEELFGKDKVAPIGTIGEAKIRTAFADLCRVVGISQSTYMEASKELPEDVNGTLTFKDAMEIPAFKDFIERYSVLGKLLPPMVGVVRSTGQHAGGVCIADVPVASTVPVVRAGAKEGGNIVTAFGESGAERALESIGFIKFDFLATDTVDHVSLCARSLYEEHLAKGGEKWVQDGERLLYPEQIPSFSKNDPEVMKAIFYTGNTDGIFQFEESVGKNISSLVKPDSVEELADISTMIRPGCLQAKCSWNIPDADGKVTLNDGNGLHFLYAARKFHGPNNPPPNLPAGILEVLRPTHYCCIYQEQMMFLIERITGGAMSLGEGDIYRRAVEHGAKGKQDAIDTLNKMEAEMKKVSPFAAETVDEVCRIIKGGAAYSFNKSHSVAYSLFSYAQAWFKHYYPHVFVASHVSLLAAKNKLDKVHKIVNNARSLGIEIRAPHVMHSAERATWSADGKTIYLPFTVMKGVKDETARAIPRIGKGCVSVFDFIVRSRSEPSIRKNHLVDLARIGAFDDMGVQHRIKTVAAVNYVMARATAKSTEEQLGVWWREAMAFGVMGDLDKDQRTKAEIEVFGSFINESPLDKIKDWAERNGWIGLSTIEPAPKAEFKVYFLITAITKKVHKSGNSKGKEWLKLTCWDGTNVCELSIWSHDLEDQQVQTDNNVTRTIPGYRPLIEANKVYLAVVQAEGDRPVSLARRRQGWGDDFRETLIQKNQV